MTHPAPGTVIEYADGDRHHLGYVLESGRSLLIVKPDGSQPRISNRAVTQPHVLSWSETLDVEKARDLLIALERMVCGHVARGDVEEAWALLDSDGGRAAGTSELAELVFGKSDPSTRLAVERLLRKNPAWFKRREEVFQPRAREQVDALLRQAEAEARAAQALSDFAKGLADVTQAKASRAERLEMTRDFMRDPAHRERIELLEGFAVLGDEHPRAGAAASLLDSLSRGGVLLRGRGSGRAFHLLTDLGVFGIHESLSLRRRSAPVAFAEHELEAAQGLAAQDDAYPGRRDLTHLEVVTIDGATTRDIDDGLSVERRPDGGFQLGIHITDPSAVIALDSEVDETAQCRGTSIYLPERTIPMLPRVLSEGRLSLIPGEVRPALSFLVDFDPQGEPSGYEIVVSIITSRRKMTYDEVDEILTRGGDPMSATLDILDQVAADRVDTRLRGGAVILDIPETKIQLHWSEVDPEALDRVEMVALEDTPSRVLVREMMILAGELAGDFCDKHQVPVLYRAQSPPDELAREEALAGRRLEMLDAFAARRHMRRAELVFAPAPHFGLGVPSYVQVTSPIRRYGDLLCHHQISAVVRGEPLPISKERLTDLAARIDALTGNASMIERERRRYWSLVHLRAFKREQLDATVIDFTDDRRTRAIVLLDRGLIQAYVPVRRSQLAIGARVKLRVESLNPRRDILHLAVAS